MGGSNCEYFLAICGSGGHSWCLLGPNGHLSGDLSARAVLCTGVSAELFLGLFPAGGQKPFLGYLRSIFLFSRIPSAVVREECRNYRSLIITKHLKKACNKGYPQGCFQVSGEP